MSAPVFALALALLGAAPSTGAGAPATTTPDAPAPVARPATDGAEHESAPKKQPTDAVVVDTPADTAREPTVDELIANAERLLEKQKHALALEQVQIVLDEGGLSRTLHARARVVLGRALAKTATPDDAVSALTQAVMLGATLPTSTDPVERAHFDAARAAAAAHKLVARAEKSTLARPGVVVTLVEDGLGLVGAVQVDQTTTVPLSRENPVAFVPTLDGETLPAFALVDERGNALVDLVVTEPVPHVASDESSLTIANMPWLTAAGGAVMLTGAIGLATAGTLAALADKGSSVITPDLKLPLLVGVGVAALVAAAGAALVLVDQLLLAPGRTDDESKPEGP